MQQLVHTFNQHHHRKPMSTHARLLDAQSELGELAKAYLESSHYGTQDFTLTQDFALEFGDVLYCLLSLADELKIDAKQCLQAALQKYQTRLDQKQSMGSK